MKKNIFSALLVILFLASSFPAHAGWIKKIGGRTFICEAENGDATCNPLRKDPLYGSLSFLITRQQTSDLDPKEVQEIFEDVVGKNLDFLITDSHLTDCGTKHDSFRVYRLIALKKGHDTALDLLVRTTYTSFYWMMYFHDPDEPPAEEVFTPKMLDAFCTQIF